MINIERSFLPRESLKYIPLLDNPDEDIVATALVKLWDLANNDENKIAFGRSPGLVEKLVSFVKADAGMAAVNALGCLWYLSRANENKGYLASEELGLIPFLVVNVSLSNNKAEYSFNILINCSLEPSSHSYLLSDAVGYLAFVRRQMTTDYDTDAFVAIANVTSCISSHRLPSLIRYRIHEVIIEKLIKKGRDVYLWNGRSGGIVYWCLNFLIDFTNYREIHYLLRTSLLYNNDFLYQLLPCREIESLKSLCIICNLSEEWEQYEKWCRSCLTDFPHLKKIIIACLGCTLDCDLGKFASYAQGIGFVFGILSMRVMTNTIRILCRSDFRNCSILNASPDFIKLLFRTLDLFIEGKPELVAKFDCIEHAGGGKEDLETLRNVVEIIYFLLLHALEELGRSHHPKKKLNAMFPGLTARVVGGSSSSSSSTDSFTDVGKKCAQLLALPEERKVPEETKILVQLILKKLRFSE
jgi:hypothetical protein